jgi:putative ABC transport system ATP-binding protein
MSSRDHAPLISLRHVSRSWATAAGTFTALDDVSLDVDPGELVALVGASGSGKSTLLNVVAGIDRPSAGTVRVGDAEVHAMSERLLPTWRGRTVGVVFQFFQLLPTLTAIENVMLPMDFGDAWPPRERRDRAAALLARLGVSDQADKLPSTLSGGQQQRVAIARALANAPSVLLADEPTGNLDSRNAASILELFGALAADGQTVLMATHDAGIQRLASRTVTITDGRIAAEPVQPAALQVAHA